MKKFVVDRIEVKETEDNVKYLAIFDKDGNDWYGEQNGFLKDTLKVMYNKESLLILSRERDVSMLAPTMVGDVVEEINYDGEVTVNPALYFVDGKMVELKQGEKIENGKIIFDRDFKIDEIYKELSRLKTEHSERAFIFKEQYMQRNRELDKNNLNNIVTMMLATKQTKFEGWKFKDENEDDVYVTLNLQDIMELSKIMTEQTTKAMRTETTIREKLETLSDEELKSYNAEKEFEKLWES